MPAENKNKNEDWFDFIKGEFGKWREDAVQETIEKTFSPKAINTDYLREKILLRFNIILNFPKLEYKLQDFKNPNLSPEFINTLNSLNKLFWKNFTDVNLRYYPLYGYAEKDKQLKAVVDFYDSVFDNIEYRIHREGDPFYLIEIQKYLSLKEIANSQTIYRIIVSSNTYTDFKEKIDKLKPTEELSLEDIISKDTHKQFLPENTFFDLTSMYQYVPVFILQDFKKYLINAKNFKEEDANKFIETTQKLFLGNYKIKAFKDRLIYIDQLLNQKLQEANEFYKAKLKEYKTKQIKIKKPQELTSIENYILDLKKKAKDISQSIYKLDESFKAYLVALNLNYDTLSNNNLEPLKQYFKENDSTFKRYGLFNLGKEMIDKGILKGNKDPANTGYEFINEFLNRLKLEDKIKNWNYENFLKEQKKII